jgi:hypothetical protein
VFVPFWGHTRADEKIAFQQAIDFMVAHLAAHPDAFIYHYASYEESAIKRLAMLHGTRENAAASAIGVAKIQSVYVGTSQAEEISRLVAGNAALCDGSLQSTHIGTGR